MRIGPWIMDAAFVGLLLLAFVGMEPFALRNPATDLSTGPYTATGMGDSVRQVFYIAIFVTIVTLAFLHRGLAVVTAVPPMLALLLAWCLGQHHVGGFAGCGVSPGSSGGYCRAVHG